jgi:hypothetical protein
VIKAAPIKPVDPVINIFGEYLMISVNNTFYTSTFFNPVILSGILI